MIFSLELELKFGIHKAILNRLTAQSLGRFRKQLTKHQMRPFKNMRILLKIIVTYRLHLYEIHKTLTTLVQGRIAHA